MQANDESVVYDELLKLINTNRMAAGERMPSENELAETYQVPRMTVRKAYQQLENRGYVMSVKGKGRFLKEESRPIKLHLSGSESFTDKMIAAGYDLRTEVFQSGEHPHPARADYFSGPAYNISRLRLINDEPIAIHHSFLNMEMFPTIQEDAASISSMFSYYRACGYSNFENGKSLLSIQFPTADEQKRLHCSGVVPLIKLESSTIDGDSGNVLEYTHILYRGDKFTYELDH
ncbi:GntR family transcriptional regulator [Alkalicoccobacillus murimartini]|uniref:GntR family transcriptional regulator n=1 Tax=Alkalicoccobacillus murimartini TaxID=171685 RepID=A0ABT9YGI0_9BACI|nr:GntR family transcriptional regulator [Alkalicoccobacillus murimartini]MDQ0206974.1 GntR family transcriptional regulator [Alkalicoccobacillus murimartini]